MFLCYNETNQFVLFNNFLTSLANMIKQAKTWVKIWVNARPACGKVS